MARKRAIISLGDGLRLPPPDSPAGQHYSYVTLRPWPNLLFVLPMLVAFEISLYRGPAGQVGETTQLVAVYLIERMVIALGAGRFGYLFPTLAIVAILLSSHLAARHPWRFDAFVLFGMLGESLTWTVPLLVFNRVLHEAVRMAAGPLSAAWHDQVIRSLGAGLYEELIFRLIGITALDILLVNVCRFHRAASRVFSVLLSATLFAAQHHPPLGADAFDLTDFMFRTAAGVYLGTLFLYRGFGITAGCHVFYNVIVVTLGILRG